MVVRLAYGQEDTGLPVSSERVSFRRTLVRKRSEEKFFVQPVRSLLVIACLKEVSEIMPGRTRPRFTGCFPASEMVSCERAQARGRARYPVALSEQQRADLLQRMQAGGLSATQEMHAQVLLSADQNTSPHLTHAQIARALAISLRTVTRLCQRFTEQGLEALFSATAPIFHQQAVTLPEYRSPGEAISTQQDRAPSSPEEQLAPGA